MHHKQAITVIAGKDQLGLFLPVAISQKMAIL